MKLVGAFTPDLNGTVSLEKTCIDLVANFTGKGKESRAFVYRQPNRLSRVQFNSGNHACHFGYASTFLLRECEDRC